MIGFVLHGGHSLTWTAWHPEPALLAGLAAAAAFYLIRITAPAVEWPGARRAAAYFLGLALVGLALGSPLDVGAGQSFALHMLQHIILSTWVPPLVLLGLSGPILIPLVKWPPVASLLTTVTHPVIGASVFTFNMWFWHVPPVYDLAVSGPVHYVMHLSFLASGLLFWWTLIAPVQFHRVDNAWRLFYVFVTGLPMMALAFALIASPSVLYEYYESQPRLWGMSPLTDQQIGGALMGSLGELTMLIPFTLLFIKVLSDDENDDKSGSTKSALRPVAGDQGRR